MDNRNLLNQGCLGSKHKALGKECNVQLPSGPWNTTSKGSFEAIPTKVEQSKFMDPAFVCGKWRRRRRNYFVVE